jgi:hypothetical protein
MAGSFFCTFLLAVGTGCGFDEGPSLQVEVRDTVLSATTGDSSLCCCWVSGTAENLSTVPIHATLKFKAYRSSGSGEEEIASAVDFLKDLQPGENRPFDASGLLVPCSNIDRFELVELDIRGVWFPP